MFCFPPPKALPCWHSLCWCLPGWAFFKRHCIRNMGNMPRKLSSTMLVDCYLFVKDTPKVKPLRRAETRVWAQSTWCFLPLCSTAYLCRASCSSSVTSTTMASSSAKPVRLAGGSLLLFWVSDDQPDAFLLPSSRCRPRGRSLCAHHVALPAGQHHHTVSSQILSIHSRM